MNSPWLVNKCIDRKDKYKFIWLLAKCRNKLHQYIALEIVRYLLHDRIYKCNSWCSSDKLYSKIELTKCHQKGCPGQVCNKHHYPYCANCSIMR
jgi:hypothetical protein